VAIDQIRETRAVFDAIVPNDEVTRSKFASCEEIADLLERGRLAAGELKPEYWATNNLRNGRVS
jgi:hypothetical protein